MRRLIPICVFSALFSIILTGCSGDTGTVTKIMGDNMISKSYNEKKVSLDEINELVEAAQSVPSVRSVSQWQFIAVGGEAMNKLSKIPTLGEGINNAPAAIVICGLSRRMNEGDTRALWIQDCSAATQNIIITARAMGMVPNLVRVYPMNQRIRDVAHALDLDPGVIPFSLVALGYADDENIEIETPARQPELKIIGSFDD